jgi:hypothetical protein
MTIRAYRFCFRGLTHCRRPDCPHCQGTGLIPVLVTIP